MNRSINLKFDSQIEGSNPVTDNFGELILNKEFSYNNFMKAPNTLERLPSIKIPEEGFLKSRSPSIVLPSEIKYNPKSKTAFDKFMDERKNDPPKKFIATDFQKIQLLPSNEPSNTNISHLQEFLIKFFKNEKDIQNNVLNKTELGLIGSIFTRKYGKSVIIK